MRLPVRRRSDGAIEGRLSVDPAAFEVIDGVEVKALHRFLVIDSERLVFSAPSPFAALGPVPFARASRSRQLLLIVQQSWRGLVARTRPSLELAQTLAPNAQVFGSPWRIEGSLRIHYEDVRLLFSRRGARACICALNGRPIVRAPNEPRVVIAAPLRGSDDAIRERWNRAIEQAKNCAEEDPRDAGLAVESYHISLDLAGRALADVEDEAVGGAYSMDLSSADLPR